MALKDKLGQINKLKLELDALQPMNRENDMNFWKKVRLDWNFNSNHIEGNTLTYGETMLLLIFDKTTGDHELREYEEMKAHDVAIHIVKDWAKDKSRDLTESDIRELNKVILIKPYWKEAITPDGQQTRRQIKVGEYKEHPNSVRLKTGEVFQYTSPLETPLKMAELMQWYRDNDRIHPLLFASQLHYDFIRIHPFDDGNGRVARLLVNYVLMKNGYPPIIVKAAEKDKYLTALNKADTGDINAFHEYMADQLIWSLELAIKAAKGENIEEPDDLDKRVALFDVMVGGVNQTIQKIKNEEVMHEILMKVVEPLFRKVFETVLKISPLFISTELTYYIDGAGSPHHNINELLENIEISWEQKRGDIRKIDLEIHFIKLRKLGIQAFDIYDRITFEFEEHKYKVLFQQNESIDKLYHQFLTEKEIQEIATQVGNNVVNNIERTYNDINKQA
jgi:Fic family protein